ncbi:hypothetical protein [Luteolibacter sp. AS25]|uniref:hypothetical protein n=1 Tax=Luteolibacter sp. AS25 TaxID=3135776 RepID=UPI00398BA139
MITVAASRENDWRIRSKQLSRRINLAWYLQTLSGPLLVSSVTGALVAVILRRQFAQLDLAILAASLFGLILLVAFVCFFIARSRFESPENAMIRLEAGMNLDSALSSAEHGASQWPDVPSDSRKLLRWHLPKTIIPPIAALALLLLGFWIPISPKIDQPKPPSSQPQAWSQLDSQLQQLSEDAVVDEEYIEEMEERLDQLRAQEEEDWFSHASLEATDSLMDAQDSNLEKLEQNLADAKNALESLSEKAEGLNSEQKQKLADDFESALEGLKNGAMKPNPELMDQLSKLDPNDMGKLSPEQLSQLKGNLENMKQSLREMQQESSGEGWEEELMTGENGNGDGSGDGQEGEGNGTGSGGIQRGPGHDPNLFKDEKDPLEIGELTALDAEDLSRAVPGDLLQLQDGEHSVDDSKSTASSGGDASKGKGGDRVWRDSLAPDEQRALKKYFE